VIRIDGPEPAKEGKSDLIIQYVKHGYGYCIEKLYINGTLKKNSPCSKHVLKAGTYKIQIEDEIKPIKTFNLHVRDNLPVKFPYNLAKCGPSPCRISHTCPQSKGSESLDGVPRESDAAISKKAYPPMELENTNSIEAALEESFNSDYEVKIIRKEEKRIVNNCRKFLKLPKNQFDVGPAVNWNPLWFKGIRCFALDLYSSATNASTSFLGQDWTTPKFYKKMPPIMSLSLDPESTTEQKRAIEKCQPWKKYEDKFKIVAKNQYEFEIESETWEAKVWVYASGDFNADGVEDLLIRRDAWPIGGSLYNPSLFVITRNSSDECFRVIKSVNN
jgi:hypothetical protein